MVRLVVAGVVLLVVLYSVTQSRKGTMAERDRVERESAEKMYQRQDTRVAEQRKAAYDAAKGQRLREIEQNAPERAFIQREYPDAWQRLSAKAGRSLDQCLVSARNISGAGGERLVELSARCGESLQESIHGS
jgi:hypothetical protein